MIKTKTKKKKKKKKNPNQTKPNQTDENKQTKLTNNLISTYPNTSDWSRSNAVGSSAGRCESFPKHSNSRSISAI
jgi:hypothetical protein